MRRSIFRARIATSKATSWSVLIAAPALRLKRVNETVVDVFLNPLARHVALVLGLQGRAHAVSAPVSAPC